MALIAHFNVGKHGHVFQCDKYLLEHSDFFSLFFETSDEVYFLRDKDPDIFEIIIRFAGYGFANDALVIKAKSRFRHTFLQNPLTRAERIAALDFYAMATPDAIQDLIDLCETFVVRDSINIDDVPKANNSCGYHQVFDDVLHRTDIGLAHVNVVLRLLNCQAKLHESQAERRPCLMAHFHNWIRNTDYVHFELRRGFYDDPLVMIDRWIKLPIDKMVFDSEYLVKIFKTSKYGSAFVDDTFMFEKLFQGKYDNLPLHQSFDVILSMHTLLKSLDNLLPLGDSKRLARVLEVLNTPFLVGNHLHYQYSEQDQQFANERIRQRRRQESEDLYA